MVGGRKAGMRVTAVTLLAVGTLAPLDASLPVARGNPVAVADATADCPVTVGTAPLRQAVNGANPFENTCAAAAGDGPPACVAINRDIWFLYFATGTGDTSVKDTTADSPADLAVTINDVDGFIDNSEKASVSYTVAGLVLATLHRIPRTGEELQIPGYTITVLEADARRVAAVKIAPSTAPASTAGAA